MEYAARRGTSGGKHRSLFLPWHVTSSFGKWLAFLLDFSLHGEDSGNHAHGLYL